SICAALNNCARNGGSCGAAWAGDIARRWSLRNRRRILRSQSESGSTGGSLRLGHRSARAGQPREWCLRCACSGRSGEMTNTGCRCGGRHAGITRASTARGPQVWAAQTPGAGTHWRIGLPFARPRRGIQMSSAPEHEVPAGRAARFRAAFAESPPLLWSFLYSFCLLSGYYVLRPVREAMVAASDVGAVFPPALVEFFARRDVALGEFVPQFIFTAVFLVMLALQPVYGWLVSRFPRRVFLPVIYGFFIATLLVFHALFDSGVAGRGLAFVLWLTVFNLFAVAVFWSFMADVYGNVEARRYYGYIGAAGTLGAFLGPMLTGLLVERLGIADLMLVSCGLLALCVVCILRLRPYAVAREQLQGRRSGELPMGGEVLAGLKLVAREPLLRWLALMVVLGIGAGTLLYNEQIGIARAAFADAEQRTAFFSRIDLAVNTVTLVVQLLFTRALMSRFGIAPALL